MKKFVTVLSIFCLSFHISLFSQNLTNTRKPSDKNVKKIMLNQKNIDSERMVVKGTASFTNPVTAKYAGPNLVPFMPSLVPGFNWDDAILVSNSTGANKDGTLVWDCRNIYLSFAVLNNGTSSVLNKFYVKIIIDGSEYYTDSFNTEVIPNNFVYWRDVNIGKLVKGEHWITLAADVTNTVAESNEDDNTYTKYKLIVYDSIPPVITHTPPTSASVGKAVTITASAYDYETSVVDFYLKYRVSGDLWDNNLFVNFSNGSAVIPASYVTDKGVDYKIVAADEEYNYGYYYSVNDNYSDFYSIPVTVPITSITGKVTKGGSEFTAYRLFSLPYDFSTVLADDLFKGAGDFKKGWRLRILVGTSTFTDGATIALEKEKAYFLITKDDYLILPKNNGITARLNYYDYVGLPVKTGWNLVGNPFPFRVATTKLRVINPNNYDLSKIPDAYEYLGKSGWLKADYLNPWEGLAVYSDFDTKLEFWVGYTDIGKQSSKYLNNSQNWVSKLIVENGETMDQENYFGVQEKASYGKDIYDTPEPPVIEDGVSAYFPHPEWNSPVQNFSEDIKPVNEQGNEWLFTVKSGSMKPVTITFDGISNIQDKYNKYLFDPGANLIYDLALNSSVKIPGFIGEKNFKILIGEASFIKNKSNIDLIPSKISLSQNYPNPFNPSTSIRFSLPNDAHAKIILYDTYGRIVKTVADGYFKSGYHDILINGNDLSTGIYYYKLEVNGKNGFSEVKKMVLLK